LEGTHVIFRKSDDAKELVLFGELGVKSSRVIQSSGVDLKRFRPIEKPRGTPIIVLAARMLRHKGVIEFVEAAKIIHSNGIDARMVLVGEPDPQNPSSIPAPQLKAWHDSRMVEWWGWQEDIESVYAQASIVCLPSYREGLPKSLIEATACGLPIVATDSNGCRDVVIDGVNGFLVPIGDAVKLANALLILINDSSLRQKMGNKGRELAEIHFDTTRINNETFLIYDLKAQ
jgi:glycosyltransferase involved in cell wall biosynthesis